MNIKKLIPWNREGNGDLTRMETENPFYSLQREMNRLFDHFTRSIFDVAPLQKDWTSIESVMPSIDVTESDDEFQVTAELPGMDEKDVEVSLGRDVLKIKGEKKAEKESKKKGYYRMERSYGAFHRSIPIPCEVDPDKAEASFKKGVLTITLPKTAKAKEDVKKIEVKA